MNAAVRSLLPALLDDAERRSGVPQTQLRIVAIESVVWRDGALGCPQPGMLYAQVLVPGHRVRIAAVEATIKPLEYHLGARGRWLFCAAGQAQPPLPREADPRL